ncbi:outer membrane protein assembly factor BamE [Simplicispira hankyongi]|uniref:Outer membrane protein assembly factor BamE n=1 Tax=Simplicispira hankyongi TaxID=2315688 RepID=A0A398CDQ9_9BURK|nr:outer membrane protein assembly factor BamE [Simplicispira hankyongi]RID97766.1 outer membrane protein assembly factor BamE [Simplicispira hankyongi]
MYAPAHCGARLGAILSFGALLAGCSAFNTASSSVASVVTPYRVEVVQGNFVSREQVQALQPGMGRQQVREILGTPLLTSLFHDDRWEYVFTLKRPGVDAQTRKLTVYFKGDALDHFEGDEMPTESDFVASLETRKGKGKVPVLEATEQQLARYPAPAADGKTGAALEPTAQATPGRSYPPLEPTTR